MRTLTVLLAFGLLANLGPVEARPGDQDEKPWVVYDGADGPGKGKHVVLISGDEEYRSEETLPQMAKILAKHHGFKCTVLFAIDPKSGCISPPTNNNIPGLEALATADLMVIFTRFRNLPDEQMKRIVDYVESGKPVIGLRTATHAFRLANTSQYLKYTYNGREWDGGFGRQVLGETWVTHLVPNGRGSTRGLIVKGQENHPVVRGVKDGDIWGPTGIYEVKLPMRETCTPLVLGQALTGMNPSDPPDQGRYNNPMMPVAWTNSFKAPNGKTARTFATTVGASQDFASEGLRRLLVNATYWALGMESQIPERSKVDIVGEFRPSQYRPRGFVPDVKPASLKMDTAPASPAQITSFKFDFGGRPAPGHTAVAPTMAYTKVRGYGFEPGSKVVAIDRGGADAMHDGCCTSDTPFYFSIAVPEGNYRVKVTLGDAAGESTTTVKAELRRLMLERVHTSAGKFETRTFIVNVRTPTIAGGGEVKLKDREKTTEAWAWDEKLTLEFNNARPCVSALTIERADDVPTVYLLGDSTVCDQPSEPFNSWGQMLTRFFTPAVAVANHAESGESLRSSLGARRLDKVLSTLKPGDYLFLQFGHNDMKAVDAASYKTDLKRFVAAARTKGGRPVLLTPMHRRTFQGNVITNSHRDFPDAARQAAAEEGVPLIDLHAMSKALYEALGPEKSAVLFKPGDGTHHSNYGSYQLAKCVVEGIKKNQPDLARLLSDDVPAYNPSRPDPPEAFTVPASPPRTADGG